MASFVLSSLTLVLLFHFASLHVFATDAVVEEGYTVTTVIDGHKLGINPSYVLLRPGSSDLIVLDSSGSAFYAIAFPVSKDSVIKPFSGTGEVGYVDGEPGSARFSKPRSFAIDLKGNVYVADKHNNVIRKITDSGVTTIAGVYQKSGRKDGPVQNATFSNDFELVFVPEICALLVSDHGSQLVRQIDLKAEDCRKGSESGSGSGVAAVSIWSVAVGVACIVGFAVGLAARPYIFPYGGIRMHRFSETWKLCLINLEKQIQIPCFAIRSAIASSSLVFSPLERLFRLSLSHLSLIFRTDYLVPQVSPKEHVSLLDYDKVDGSSCSNSSSSSEKMKSQKYANQLKDLISFDESLELSNLAGTKMFQQREEYLERQDVVLSDCYGNGIDNLIETNIMHFAEVTKETALIDGALFGSSGLVKRRRNS